MIVPSVAGARIAVGAGPIRTTGARRAPAY